MPITMFDVAPRVSRGATLLDQTFRLGWASKSLFETLDVADAGLCLLGQLYGDFEEGTRKLGLIDEGAVAYGFYPSTHPDEFGVDVQEVSAEYDLLTEAWKKEIDSRLRRTEHRHVQGGLPLTHSRLRQFFSALGLFPV